MRKSIVVLTAALLGLVGCRGEVHSDLKLSTLAAALAGAEQTVAARLGIEVGTQENCDAYKAPLQVALTRGFAAAVFLQCRTEKDTVFADYRVSLAVTDAAAAIKHALVVQVEAQAGRNVVWLRRSRAQINRITEALPKDMRDAMGGPLDPEISVRLDNDSAEKIAVTLPAAFVNGVPQQVSSVVTLRPAGAVSMALSDLGNAALYREGSLLFSWPQP